MKYFPAENPLSAPEDPFAGAVESTHPIKHGSIWSYHGHWKARVSWDGDRLMLHPLDTDNAIPFLPWTEAMFRRCMLWVSNP